MDASTHAETHTHSHQLNCCCQSWWQWWWCNDGGGDRGGDSGSSVARWLLVETSRVFPVINSEEVFIFTAVLTMPGSDDRLYLILCCSEMNRLIDCLVWSSKRQR